MEIKDYVTTINFSLIWNVLVNIDAHILTRLFYCRKNKQTVSHNFTFLIWYLIDLIFYACLIEYAWLDVVRFWILNCFSSKICKSGPSPLFQKVVLLLHCSTLTVLAVASQLHLPWMLLDWLTHRDIMSQRFSLGKIWVYSSLLPISVLECFRQMLTWS